MANLNVLHIVPYVGDEASGPAYCVPAICDSLQKKGCQISLYTLNPLPEKKFSFQINGFQRSNFPHPAFGRSPEMYKALLKEVNNVDIIHNHSLWMAPNIYSGLVSKKYGIPYICTPHGTMSQKALQRSNWKKKIALTLGQQLALDYTTCFHATAVHEVNDINAYCSGKPVSMIPNGVDIPPLIPIKKSKRKKLMFLGRIHPIKGIENLIKSWSQLEDKFTEWDLEIIGLGDVGYTNTLLNLIKSLDLTRVNLLDPVFGEDKNAVYQKANIYVLPSFSENFGMTIAEALANATPVITTDATPWADIEKRKCGWYIPVGQESLKATLEIALNKTSNELSEMGKKGREWMNEDFSWDSLAEDMIATYNWVLSNKNKPNCIVNE
tara:strand:+ start:5284 stop:6426 length:1143 start_codon:yes stop_codon:yes gene_type:complete